MANNLLSELGWKKQLSRASKGRKDVEDGETRPGPCSSIWFHRFLALLMPKKKRPTNSVRSGRIDERWIRDQLRRNSHFSRIGRINASEKRLKSIELHARKPDTPSAGQVVENYVDRPRSSPRHKHPPRAVTDWNMRDVKRTTGRWFEHWWNALNERNEWRRSWSTRAVRWQKGPR